MNLDDLYIMLDEKEERDNPFITPKTKQAHDIFYKDILEVIERLTNEDDILVRKAESAFIKLVSEEQRNAFMIGYRTAVSLILVNGQ